MRQNSILVLGQLFLLPVEMYITTGNANIPCAKIFAVCFFRAHGKDTNCRVLKKNTRQRENTRQTPLFTVCRLPDTRRRLSTWQTRAHAVWCHYTPWRRSFFSCAYTWHTAKPYFCRVSRARHTAKSLRREACLMDVSVCCVPRKAHGEQLPLLCASPLAHGKNQPLLCASLQHTANLFKMF